MGTRLGRYDILRTLARGALTDLLLGRATGPEGFARHVAIKRLREEHAQDPAVLEMFVNEARLAAALHHHNIVQVVDLGDGGGEPFFAMEYVHGVDLRTLLAHLGKRNEQLPIQHVVSIIAAAAAALHHAHDQRGPDGKPLGIVHRQVTPGNILVGFDGNVKIVDFGIAKAAIKRSETGAGVLRGIAPYMAPEQCAGQRVDRRSDVFALGIVLFELATVRRLFKGGNEFLTMSAVVNADVPRPSQYRRDVPAELEVIMLKALARDSLARFQTAGDMAEALDRIARVVGVGASTTQLANYLKLQLGERKEPWLAGGVEADPEITEVDFDGAASGLAPPPAEAVKNFVIPRSIDATKTSPIHHARTSVATPPRPKPATAPPPEPAHSRASTEVDASERTDPLGTAGEAPPPLPAQRTNVAAPPPPPTTGTIEAVRKRGAEMTAIVEPLSVVAARAETQHTGSSRRLVLLGGGAIVLLALIIGAIALWPSSALDATPTAAPSAAPASPAAPPRAPSENATREESPPARPAMEMTARDYDEAQAIDASVAEPIAEAASDAAVIETEPVAKPEPEPEIVVETAPSTKRAESKPAVRPAAKTPKRTATKPTSKRTKRTTTKKKPAAKKAAKPTWNPDDLFLGE